MGSCQCTLHQLELGAYNLDCCAHCLQGQRPATLSAPKAATCNLECLQGQRPATLSAPKAATCNLTCNFEIGFRLDLGPKKNRFRLWA